MRAFELHKGAGHFEGELSRVFHSGLCKGHSKIKIWTVYGVAKIPEAFRDVKTVL